MGLVISFSNSTIGRKLNERIINDNDIFEEL